jgi:ketosteroid isomerase-like protein
LGRELVSLVHEYFRCANEEDWPGMAAVWAQDAELVGMGGAPRRGREQIVDGYRRFMALWPEHRDEPGRILVCGEVATVEVRFTGVNRAGRACAFDAVDVIDFEHALIKRLTNWYDLGIVGPMLREKPGS